MDSQKIQEKRESLIQALEQVRLRIGQLQQELTQGQAQEQRMIGALLLCDELLVEQVESPQA